MWPLSFSSDPGFGVVVGAALLSHERCDETGTVLGGARRCSWGLVLRLVAAERMAGREAVAKRRRMAGRHKACEVKPVVCIISALHAPLAMK